MGEVINLLEKKKKDKTKVEKLLLEYDWHENIKLNKEKEKKIKEENLKRNKVIVRAFNLKNK